MSLKHKERCMGKEAFARIRRKNLHLIEHYANNNNNYSYAMRIIAMQAKMSYLYNQFYFDEELEIVWKEIINHLPRGSVKEEIHSERALWYDAFGLGDRGLAYIYLQALDRLGYQILYVTYDGVQSTLKRIEDVVNKEPHKAVFLPKTDAIKQYHILTELLVGWGARNNFLYTTPYDVAGIAAFENLPQGLKRYQVNLTDHAYWLGTNAFDICIDFRDLGASISYFYRKIPKEKIQKLPYYPTVNRDVEFKGYPFIRKPNQKVMFSGGSIYKTLDKDGTFYKIVDKLMAANTNLIFWYAGDKKSAELSSLEEKYGGRVVFTAERSDLYQVLNNIDVYFNTYPVSGGLMLQYAALAGRVPFTLLHDEEPYGMLLKDKGVYYWSKEEMLSNIDRYMKDDDYRKDLEQGMENAVIEQDTFIHNLQKLIKEGTTEFPIIWDKPNMERFQQTYFENWTAKECYRVIVGQKNIVIYLHYFREVLAWIVLAGMDMVYRWRNKIRNIIKSAT